jgi:hypothetical protein
VNPDYHTDYSADTLQDLEWAAEFEVRWRELTEPPPPARRREDPLASTIRANGATRVLAALSRLVK